MDAKARLLKRVMSDLSEEYFSAQWPVGNEFRLWADLTGEKVCGERAFGISDEEREELRLAHELAGGWVVWSGEERALTFLADPEWLEHVAARSKA